ncbi:hypothetical protein [Pseudomonas guariconensis]|uniref:hypothetical protein n=1 Tax=Pseudomonas guariconensis TaxID=1288410 RepID=UPI002D1EC84C|nr:hypothetical protein [Pseudomonas guariconensis]MEB3843944.1 hypothetical protein [Pseudomonas guariconensis]MEB3876812.1 hypothetical protein [Pseudomonas guariconensis]MEB3881728.1 hypothetical protein [Pseudomonas guariconensis]MEB3898493.1 hypothetical protein [Pseudomonas guariconensis]
MALTQKQRDEKRRKKAEAAQEEDLRLKVRPGTRQALAEIKEWAEVEENGEAMTLLIHRIHELGSEAARHFLSAPRHEIVISKYVEQSLERFRLSRELRAPALMLGDDPDDTGLLLLASA